MMLSDDELKLLHLLAKGHEVSPSRCTPAWEAGESLIVRGLAVKVDDMAFVASSRVPNFMPNPRWAE